jgi:uncharacterized protein
MRAAHGVLRSLRVLGALLALAAFPAGAQRLEARAIPSRNIEAFTLMSPTMGERYDITVGYPSGYRPGAARTYPALIVTDGNHVFPLAFSVATNLMEARAIEELFIISIATPYEEGDSAWVRRRMYEFSPPGWGAMTDPFGTVVKGLCRDFRSPSERCVGGAPRFLELIVGELIPRITEKYPIDRAQLGLFGVSAGGFFASWAIFQAESPFRKYIISSPAMAYGDGEIFRQEQRHAAGHKDLAAGIYMASGSLEMDDPYLEGIGHIVSGQIRLAAALRGRKYPGLELFTEIHHGLGHGDAAGTTLVRGMRLLYAR